MNNNNTREDKEYGGCAVVGVGGETFMEKALSNSIILSKIFSHLTLHTLKEVRGVCRLWNLEGAYAFPKVEITLESPYYEYDIVGNDESFSNVIVSKERVPGREVNNDNCFKENLEVVGTFLRDLKVRHTLSISLLNYPWFYEERDNRRYKLGKGIYHIVSCYIIADCDPRYLHFRVGSQKNDMEFASDICKHFLPCMPFQRMVEMKLEMTLVTAEEGNVLANILKECSGSLRKLALDIVIAHKEGLSAFEQRMLPTGERFKPLKTLGLRTNWNKKYNLKEITSYSHLTSVFSPLVEYLDLSSYFRLHPISQVVNPWLLKGLSEALNQQFEQGIPSAIKGLKVCGSLMQTESLCERWTDCLDILITTFPPTLSVLVLNVAKNTPETNRRHGLTRPELMEILAKFSSTLKHFSLSWRVCYWPKTLEDGQLILPKLPRLTHLAYTPEENLDDWDDSRKTDVLGLKTLLGDDSIFKTTLPSLTSLELYVGYDGGGVFLNRLFRQRLLKYKNNLHQKNGDKEGGWGLKTLVVSCSIPCDGQDQIRYPKERPPKLQISEVDVTTMVSWIKLFPTLQVFRHTRSINPHSFEDGLVGCEHKIGAEGPGPRLTLRHDGTIFSNLERSHYYSLSPYYPHLLHNEKCQQVLTTSSAFRNFFWT